MPTSSSSLSSALVIDPHDPRMSTYDLFPERYDYQYVTSIPQATQYLRSQTPDLVLLSASYRPSQVVKVLEALRAAMKSRLTPLIMMVELKNRLNFIPGTEWGGRFGVLHSLSSEAEVTAALDRISLKQ